MKKIYSFSRIFVLLTLLFVGLGSAWAVDSWELVTDYSNLDVNGVYVIACNHQGTGSYYVLKNTAITSNANPTAFSITVSDGKITSTVNDDMKWKISVADAEKKYYYIYSNADNTKYLQNANNTGSQINTKHNTDTNNQWEIHKTVTSGSGSSQVTVIGLNNVNQKRMLGTYSGTSGYDWRAYKSTNYSNIKNCETVLFKLVEVGGVEAPVFTPEDGSSFATSISVEIEAEDDMLIAYTTDGTDPTYADDDITNGELYTAAINLTATTTIKAIAINTDNGEVSEVASATYTKLPAVASLSALKAAADGTYALTLTNAVVTYNNKTSRKGYIEEGSVACQLLGSFDVTAGKSYTGTTIVTTQSYNGFKQISAIDLETLEEADAVIPFTEVTISELNSNFANYEARRVKVVSASVATAKGNDVRSVEISQDANTIILYEQVANSFTLNQNSVITVEAYPTMFGETKELVVWKGSDVTVVSAGLTTATLSFDVTEINLNINTSVQHIASTNSDATIVYTSSNPTALSVDADGTIHATSTEGQFTITASVQENANYTAAEASYIVNVVDPFNIPTEVTFDFRSNEFNWALSSGSTVKAIPSSTTKNGVVFSWDKGTCNGNDVSIWGSADDYNLRSYSGEVFTLSAPAGKRIVSVKIVARGNYLKLDNDTHGSMTTPAEESLGSGTSNYNATWTSTSEDGVRSVSFVANNSGRYRAFVVTLKNAELEQGSFTLANINGAGWGTYYTDFAFVMPENVEGRLMKTVEGTIKAVTTYNAGDVVPANTGLLLKGTAGNYDVVETTTAATISAEGNLLKGSVEAGLTIGGTVYYKLANDPEDGLGWFWGAAEGAAFLCGAHKAYLALDAAPSLAPAVIRIADETETATSMECIEAEQAVKFIENGQLIIIKNGIRYNALGQVVR